MRQLAGAATAAGRARGLQQRRALLEHPLVVGADAGQPRGSGHDQLVEEPAALGRVAPHDGQVLRREQHRAQRAEHSRGRGTGDAVELGPVGPAGRDLDLDPQLARVGDHRGPDHGSLGAGADEWRIGRHPVAAERGQVAQRLDQVRLALAVRADEHRWRPGSKATSARAQLRKSATDRCRTYTSVATGSARQPDRHDQVGVVARRQRRRAQHDRLGRRGEQQPGGRRTRARPGRRAGTRVERGGDRLALELDLQLLLGPALVLAAGASG